jgi:hypothetical protein
VSEANTPYSRASAIVRTLALLVALAACGSKEQAQPQPGSASGGSGSSTADLLPKPEFKVEEVDFPDETWSRLAKLATRQWAQSMNKLGVTTLKLTPLKTPDGQIAPYLIHAEAKKGDKVVFENTALMSSRNGMISGGGIKPFERHLAAIGFPGKQLPLALLVEMIYLANVERAWLVQPSTSRWKLDKPEPATLVYDDTGALLTVYRDKDGLQKLEMRFDKGGLITTTKYKKTGEAWERFTE